MKSFTLEEIRALAQDHPTPAVSLLMPTHPAGQDTQQDPVRLKTLLSKVSRELEELGMRSPDIEEVLRPARKLLENGESWRQPGSGLAIYLSRGFSRIYRVPRTLPEAGLVSDSFHLTPLLPLLTGDKTWYALAVSGRSVRLLRCTPHEHVVVPIPDVPQGVEEATRFTVEPTEKPRLHAARQARAHKAGTTTAPHGFGDEHRRDNDLDDYVREIDHGLRSVLAGEIAPLVFVGITGYFPRFTEQNTYPYLVDVHVEHNAEDLSDDALRERTWEVVAPVLQERRRQDAQRYLNLLGTARVSSDLEEVLTAALYGRIDALFVALGEHRYGRLDRASGQSEIHEEEQPGDTDLVNEAAILALLRGGRVYAVPTEELPSASNGAVLDAVFRW